MESKDREFTEFVVKSIVDNPDDVKVERTVDDLGVKITIDVNPKDMGQVIGRRGATMDAIRSLAKIVGVKNNASVNVFLNEPEGGRGPRTRDESPARDTVSEERPEAPEDAPVEESGGDSSREEKLPDENQPSIDIGGTVGKVIDDIKKDL